MTSRSFLPPPNCCESLADIASRFGGAVERHVAAETIDYPLPSEASDEVRAFWQSASRAEIPARCGAQLRAGRVFGTGNVLAPDGASLARDVSLDFGKPFEEHWLLTYRKIPPTQRVCGTTAVIATTLGAGYGHWLLDQLPRLLTLGPGEFDTLIAHATQPYSRVALAHWGWSGPVLEAERNAHVQCDRLIVPCLPGTIVQPTLWAQNLLREFTTAFHLTQSAWGERIYITRETVRRRAVGNEMELWAALQDAGFAKVHLENLTWPEQINAFRHAKIIVAPHGAGLANLVFCRRGTRVLELFNRSYVNGCYWRLAVLCGLDYRPIVPCGLEPLGQSTAANRLNIWADVHQLKAALK